MTTNTETATQGLKPSFISLALDTVPRIKEDKDQQFLSIEQQETIAKIRHLGMNILSAMKKLLLANKGRMFKKVLTRTRS